MRGKRPPIYKTTHPGEETRPVKGLDPNRRRRDDHLEALTRNPKENR